MGIEMSVERIVFDDEQKWLEARTKDITSTDVAALPGFDVSPYLSPWELYQRKVSGEVPAFEPTERMKWGLRLQDAIAKGVAEDLGVKIRRLKAYYRDAEKRMGSSFDFEIVDHPDGPGIMEIKNVDSLAYRKSWHDDNGTVEAPPHIELQFQQELLLSGRSWGLIVPLVGGNEAKVVRRTRYDAAGSVICKKVAEFWAMVQEGTPPPADFTRDAKAISALYSTTDPGAVIDLTGDVDMIGFVGAYKTAAGDKKAAEKQMEEMKARILERIGGAEKVIGGAWSVSAKGVTASPGKIVTPEMVGTYIGARKGYRAFSVTLKGDE